MTEGEVAVSLGGIVAPLLIAGMAATVLSWRFAFVICGALVVVAVAASATVQIPAARRPTQARGGEPATGRPSARSRGAEAGSPWLRSTLVLVFAVVALEFSLSFWLASYLHDGVGLSTGSAAAMVGGLYAANVAGRVAASRLARRTSTARVLAAALATALLGLPVLLVATGPAVAGLGIALAGAGIGATFPLVSSLHVAGTPGTADGAVGQVLTVAAIGQAVGPVSVAVVAQHGGLRTGLLVLPALVLLAAGALDRHRRNPALE